MSDFINVQIPSTIIGSGAISNIGDMVKSFEPTKVLVITDSGIAKSGIIDAVKLPLEKAECKFDIFDGCESEPSISAIEKLGQRVKESKYDLLVGVGGGSVMDAAKIASIVAANDGVSVYNLMSGRAVNRAVNKILIPTTAGTGAEWSIFSVVSDDKVGMMTKLVVSPLNLPNAVIVDPELTINLPQKITADTGMDALSHAIEAYCCAKANIVSDIAAETAVKLISENLRLAYAKGKNIQARYNMAVAASLAIHAVVVAGVGLDHFMQEPLNKKAHIPHGESCSILLPHVMEFNMIATPAKFARIAELMGENISGLSVLDAAAKSLEAVRRLAKDLGMPEKMSDVGITEADIPAMVEEVHTKLGAMIDEMNPRDANPEDTARIFAAAL